MNETLRKKERMNYKTSKISGWQMIGKSPLGKNL